MNKYDCMINVNALWLNSIPSHWKFNQLRSILEERKETNDPVQITEILSLSAKHGVELYRQKQEIGGNKAKEDLTKYHIAHPNDLVVNCMNVISGSVGLSRYTGLISPVYYALFSRSDLYNINYYSYIFSCIPFQKSLMPLGKGILFHESSNGTLNTIRLRISMSSLRSVYLPVPPRSEQDQIVRYLDWQTSRINKLIKGYRRQIELLEERKQTIIDQYSTQGIDKNVKFKKSGTHWLPEIPEHWNTIPAKRLFFESKEKKHSTDYPATASQKYGIILQEEYMKKENKRIVIANQGLEDWKHVNPDDFVISLRSFQGGIERSTISGCVTWHYVVLLPQANVYPPYFKWLLKSKSYISHPLHYTTTMILAKNAI